MNARFVNRRPFLLALSTYLFALFCIEIRIPLRSRW
jgi:hypothetical protein